MAGRAVGRGSSPGLSSFAHGFRGQEPIVRAGRRRDRSGPSDFHWARTGGLVDRPRSRPETAPERAMADLAPDEDQSPAAERVRRGPLAAPVVTRAPRPPAGNSARAHRRPAGETIGPGPGFAGTDRFLHGRTLPLAGEHRSTRGFRRARVSQLETGPAPTLALLWRPVRDGCPRSPRQGWPPGAPSDAGGIDCLDTWSRSWPRPLGVPRIR